MFSRYSVSPSDSASSAAGFSLIELLVSIGIIILVLSIVVTQQSAFNSSVLLRSQAYEIALAVREVQLSAVSAQSDGAGDFRSVLGLHFDTDTPDRYIVFRDTDNDGFFDAGEEFGAPGLLDPRFDVADIRPSSGTLGSGNDMSIIFERPNFDARYFDASGSERIITNVQIDVKPDGNTGTVCGEDVRTVEVTSTGQVTVIECP